MRLPTVCSRHVLANADADWLCPITFIPVSLFLIYAVADCVLPTCRVWCGCWFMHPSAFFPSMTFFQAISARSCAPFQFFTLQDLVRGECDVWFFTNMILLLFRFLSFTPFMWGSSRWSTLSGWSPSNGQKQKATTCVTWHPSCHLHHSYNTILCCAFSLSLWYFGCQCLAHSDHPPKLTFSKCIAPYYCDTVKL